MQPDSAETFCPSSRKEWRQWLRKNHKLKPSVWLILYKKKTNIPSLEWSDGVDEALCFGWIDGKRVSVSEEKFMQFFSKRKAKSMWSKINKEKVKRLIEQKLMTKAGYEAIAVAKQNGSWSVMDDVEKLKIPKDLEGAFKKNAGSKKNFMLLPRSTQKLLLMKLKLAKRVETREARIKEIIALSMPKKGNNPSLRGSVTTKS